MENNNIQTRVGLKPRQIPHYNRLYNLYFRSAFAFDTSVMRAGKTYTTSELILAFKFQYVIVFAPISAHASWEKVKRLFGINIILLTTYQSLASKKGYQPSHGLLVRDDSDPTKPVFIATELYLRYVQAGIFVVFDEVSFISNKSTTWWQATKALIDPILASRGPSRFILISGTPIRKKDEVVSFLQLVGIIRERLLYNYHKLSKYLELRGAREVENYARAIDNNEVNMILEKTPWKGPNPTKYGEHITDVIYQLYIRVVSKYINSAMPGPENEVPLDIKTGYYLMLPEDLLSYRQAIGALQSAARWNPATGEVDMKNANLGGITKALVRIEASKLHTFVRLALQVLTSNPKAKVVLSFNYNASIRLAIENLKQFNPLMLNGSIPSNKRGPIIEAFQRHNSGYRLLITNMQVVGFGVDLHDAFGDEPRYAFGSSSYYVRTIHQWTHRFYSEGTKSTPTVRMVQGNINEGNVLDPSMIETSIYNSIIKSSTVFSDYLLEQVEAGEKFPGQYDIEIEASARLQIPYIRLNEEQISGVYAQDMRDEEETVVQELGNLNLVTVQPKVPLTIHPTSK